jgi:chaperonin GroES
MEPTTVPDLPPPADMAEKMADEDAARDLAIARDIAALEHEDPAPSAVTSFAVRPLYDRILIRQFEAKEIVRGNIHVPDAVKEKPARGVVLAVGEGRIMHTPQGPTLCPLLVQPGNIVLFGRYGGTDVDLDDEGRETGKILREDEVLAVISALEPPAVPVGTPPRPPEPEEIQT